jgi:hypothetical protein
MADRRLRLDWADAAVPALASVGFVVKHGIKDPATMVGSGLGYGLAVAAVFIGVRQVLATLDPRPRQPVLAALAGILVWAFVLFR